jgi:hypothetical protein
MNVYIVAEDYLDSKAEIRQVFDNAEAANEYVERNEGLLFVEKKEVKSECEK